MPQCEAIKKDGEQCKGAAKIGHKYCHYHRKRYASKITHGRTASPEFLGIPNNKKITFEEFYRSEKPFELVTELALLRTLLVEQREAMEATRPKYREAILDDFHTLSQLDLEQIGVTNPEVRKAIVDTLKPRLEHLLDEYHGPIEPLSASQYSMLGDTIERISRVALKAKTIADGITLNVDFGGVKHILIRFIREVVMREVRDPYQRARIVTAVRELNFSGGFQEELPENATEAEYEVV